MPKPRIEELGPVQEKFVKVKDINTRYLEAGSGPPLVLIHGGGAGADSWGNWYTVIEPLSKDFRVLAVDMVGYGKSDKPSPENFRYTQQNRNQHMLDFLNVLEIDSAYFVGTSMGAATSLGVAMSDAGRVKKTVLIGCVAAVLKMPLPPTLDAALNYEPSKEHMRGVVQAHGKGVDEAMVDHRYNMTMLPGTMEAYRAMIREVQKQGGLFYEDEELAEITVDTLILNGKDDTISTPADALKVSERIDNSSLLVIPRCGHNVSLDQPEITQKVVTEFMQFDSVEA